MIRSLESNKFSTLLAKFFRTRVDTPLRMARVLIGGTLGLVLLIVGGPAVIYLNIVIMQHLDLVTNLFISFIIIAHLSITQRKRISSFMKRPADSAISKSHLRIEPTLTKE